MGFLTSLFKLNQENYDYDHKCPYEGPIGIFLKVNAQEGISTTQIEMLLDKMVSTEKYMFVSINIVDYILIGLVHTKWYEEAMTILSYLWMTLLMKWRIHQVLLVNMKMTWIKHTGKLLDFRKILKDSKLGFSIF